MDEQSSELFSVQQELQTALAESSKIQADLDKAKAHLAPLEQKALDARDHINALIKKFQNLTGTFLAEPTVRAARKRRTLKPYRITDDSKISRVGKSAYTRAIRRGSPEAEARTAQKEAEKSLRAKLGG